VADIPEEAVTRAADAITLAAHHFEAGEAESSALRFARVALEAAAPILAEHVAHAILAHAERQHPRDKDHVPTAWDRHFSIAARVAAGAFHAREDELRLAAEALKRGDVIWCNPPEVPGEH